MGKHLWIWMVFAILIITPAGLKAGRLATPWDGKFRATPAHYAADISSLPFKPATGIKAVMLAGPNFKGKPSKIFCWYGVPESKDGKKVPGIVLVHGGGGWAFSKWVETWNKRGFAAIAVDTCGNLPPEEWETRKSKPIRNPEHGATEKEKYTVSIPETDQWSYHAIAAVISANSFLRSLDGVDSNKIGVTGVSWGGYLTLLAAAADERFAFAIPVYGCGFYEGTNFKPAMLKRKRTEADLAKWCKLWDPANYLANAKMPLLMVNSTDDFFFHPESWVKTTHLPGDIYMALKVQMGHSHKQADVPSVYSFASNIVNNKSYPKLVSEGVENSKTFAVFKNCGNVVRAEYIYTTESQSSKKRKWITNKLEFTPGNEIKLTYSVPEDAFSGFFNVYTGDKYPEEMGLLKNYGKMPVYSSSRPLYYKNK